MTTPCPGPAPVHDSPMASDAAHRMMAASGAMKNPTWELLRQEKWAPVILATLTTVFQRGERHMPCDDFHARVARTFTELAEYVDFLHGASDPRTVREHCKSWVAKGWLSRRAEPGGEVYRLTAESGEAIRIVESFASAKASMTESQVQVVLDRARRLALKASVDPDTRMVGLRQRIAELRNQLQAHEVELQALEAGGVVEVADDEQVHSDTLMLCDDIDRLNHDLKRVEDSFCDLERQLMREFTADTRPQGEVVAEYMRKAVRLTEESPEGRGFQQAKRFLLDEDWRSQLQQDIAATLDNPHLADSFSERARNDLRGTVRLIQLSVERVTNQRQAVTTRLSRFIQSRDPVRERDLAEVLGQLRSRLATWGTRHQAREEMVCPAGHYAEPEVRRGVVPVAGTVAAASSAATHGHPFDVDDELLWDGNVVTQGQLGVAHVSTLRMNPPHRRPTTDLEPLGEPCGTEGIVVAPDALRSAGGPFYTKLSQALTERLATEPEVTSDTLFHDLPEKLRRPVDLLGLLTIAVERGHHQSVAHTKYRAVRPDGETVTYCGPLLVFRDSSAADRQAGVSVSEQQSGSVLPPLRSIPPDPAHLPGSSAGARHSKDSTI